MKLSKAARFLRLRAAVAGEVRCLAATGGYYVCSRPVHDDEPNGGTHAAHGDSEDRPFATWRDGEDPKLTGDGIDWGQP